MANESESKDQFPPSPDEMGRRIADAASGGLAAAGVALLAAILAIDPQKLDSNLHHAIACLAIALPILVQAAILAFTKVAKSVAYTFFLVGVLALNGAMGFILTHLDQTAANVYGFVLVESAFLVVWLLLREIDRSRRKVLDAVSKLSDHTESTLPPSS